MTPRPLARVALPLVLLAGCAGEPVKPGPVAERNLPPEFVATHMAVLRCPELAPVSLQLNDSALRIDGVREPHELPLVPGGEGTKYEAAGYTVWFADDKARYQQPDDGEARECHVYPVKNPWESAALRDVTFRAVGTEPGWVLEVVPDKWILFLANYGQDRVIVPPPAPVKEGDVQRFRSQAENQALDVTVTAITCSDGMSEDVYDQQVSVTWNGVVFSGCGRWLLP